MATNKKADWIDKLMKSYHLPDETPSDINKKKSILRESQLKIINQSKQKNERNVKKNN